MLFLLLSVIAATPILIFLWFKHSFSYWKLRDVPFIEPDFPLGNFTNVGTIYHITQITQRIYTKLKGKAPFAGIYFLYKPMVVLTDLDLVRNVLIKDFSVFQDRHVFYNERDDPLSCHLFSIEGLKWKKLRSKLSPTYTSGKMKFMFPTVVEVGEKCVQTLRTMLGTGNIVEIKDLLSRYSTDVIGTCAFGIECNSLKDPQTIFRTMGQKIVQERRHNELVRIFMELNREVARFFRMKSEQDDVSEFFIRVLRETIAYREKNNVSRNDFLDLLIKLKNTGKLEKDDAVQGERVTFDEIAAQAYVFFAAGFETSSTTLSYCLYELALNEDIQNKARIEINDVIHNYGGQLTYEAMLDMKYVHQVIDETLRKYPPLTDLVRSANKDYQVPGTKFVIEKGISAMIPVFAIQNDPDIYPNPEQFDPDRFSADQVQARHPMAHLPFGDGPRNCIGSRFGKMQTYIGLIMLLKHFQFSKCAETVVPIVFNPKTQILASEGGIFLDVKEL